MITAIQLTPAQERLIATLDTLEILILELLWHQGARNVRQIHARLNESQRADFISVMASVSRLIGAGLLTPEAPTSGLSYGYRPVLSLDEFLSFCALLLPAHLREQLFFSTSLRDSAPRERSVGR